jgi:hypothetical protein
MISLFCLLLVGHALADYPLQGDFLARAKNYRQPIPGVPWIHGLFWHSVIHGGVVGLITGSVWLGVAETGVHLVIDHAKCMGWFGPSDGASYYVQRAFHLDQALHVLCKLVWVAILLWGQR